MPQFSLSPIAIANNYRLKQFEEIASTSSEALKQSKIKNNDKVWYVTKRQTKGRGRLGREWHCLDGNLATSLVLRVELSPEKCAMFGFVAGVAIIKALKSLDESLNVQLKWPNDILLDGHKMVGILLEMHPISKAEQLIIIGFGANIVAVPKDLPYLATSLKDSGLDISVFEFFERLTKCWYQVFASTNNGTNFEEILKSWKNLAFGIGKEISINNHNKTIHGIFENIDESGRLIIKTANNEIKQISAGDVHFGTAHSFRG